MKQSSLTLLQNSNTNNMNFIKLSHIKNKQRLKLVELNTTVWSIIYLAILVLTKEIQFINIRVTKRTRRIRKHRPIRIKNTNSKNKTKTNNRQKTKRNHEHTYVLRVCIPSVFCTTILRNYYIYAQEKSIFVCFTMLKK